MKAFLLHEICKMLHINDFNVTTIEIKKISDSIDKIEDDTLVFHLYKTRTLNIEKLEKLKNCFIVTDQPLLKKYQKVKDQFLFVDDIEKTYMEFVRYYRLQYRIKTIAVTGTCGKTTTKEMIKQVLSQKYQVTGTIKNRNSLRFNHEYLMDIDEKKDYGVYEMALTDPGNIIFSGKYFMPSIGIITNIGIDHLSGCKTLDNYILAKGEMLTALNNKGILIINADCPNTQKLDLSNYQGNIITTGIKELADYYATDIRYGNEKTYFTLHYGIEEYPVEMPVYGEHNVSNALQALAALDSLGFNLEEATNHLKTYQPIKAHFEFHEGYNGSIIIDDTFSSNPTSVEAAFKTMNLQDKIKIAVLGNITYLGRFEEEQCDNMGKMAVEYGIDYLITIDQFSKRIGEAAILYGMNKNHVYHCETRDDLKSVLHALLKPNVMVLFKTSMFDQKTKKTLRFFLKEKNR